MNQEEILVAELIKSRKQSEAVWVITNIIFYIVGFIYIDYYHVRTTIYSAFVGWCILSIVWSAYHFFVQVRALTWLKTECIIIRREIVKKGSRYFPELYYLFLVDGQQYICDKIKFGLAGNKHKSEAEESIKLYEKDKYYFCYYNPSRPKQAVIVNKLNIYPLKVFLGYMVIFFAYMIIFQIRHSL